MSAKSIKFLFLLFILLCTTILVFAQPVNDDPCGAIELVAETGSVCTPTQQLSWTDATATPDFPIPGCGGYSTGDVWYRFTLNSPTHVFITSQAGLGPNGISDSGMALYYSEGTCSDTMYKVLCDDDSGAGYMSQISLRGLPAGDYYVRFWDYNDRTNGSINGICLATVPLMAGTDNDEPCTAMSLEVSNGETCTPSLPLSWSNATASFKYESPFCGSYETGDVWFSFVLTDTSNVFISTTEGVGDHAITDAAMMLYTSDDCNGPLTEVNCQDNQGADLMPKLFEPQLLPGTYFIRFYDTHDSISGNIGGICVTAQPSIFIPIINDDPCGSIELIVVNDTTCLPDNPYSWTYATATPAIAQPRCGFYERGDVWFKFTLTETSDIVITTLAGTGSLSTSDGVMALYAGADCSANLEYAFCDDDSGPDNMPQIKEKGIPAGTYYIRFWDGPGKVSGGIDGICVAAVPVMTTTENDHCFLANIFPEIPLDGSCSNVSVNSTGAFGVGSDFCDGISDDDVWFQFTVPDGITDLSFTVNSNGNTTSEVVRLMRGDCSDLFPLGCYYTETGIFSDLIPGAIYTIKTFTAEAGGGEYDICLAVLNPPVNDDPCGAFTLTPKENTNDCTPDTPMAWQFASNTTTVDPPGCGSYSTGDVWFKFELTERSDIVIRTSAGSGEDAIIDGAMGIYRQDTDCNDLIKLSCLDDIDENNLMPTLIDFAFDPGIYYLRFWEYYDRISGNINVCLSTTPSISTLENDQCTGAFAFPEIPADGSCSSVHVNNTGATGGLNNGGVGFSDDDLWYSFVVPEGETNILYDITTNSGNTQHVFCLYTSCGSGAMYECFREESGRLEKLVEGETYFIRVYTIEFNAPSDYNICLKIFPSPPANDECDGAIAFPEIPLDGSCVALPVDVTWATLSGIYECGNDNVDVWYSFVMPDVLYLNVDFLTSGRFYDLQYELFTGDCGNLESLFCLRYYSRESSRLFGLTPGTKYYLRIFNSATALFEYSMCLSSPKDPPVNDLCPDALPYPAIPEDGSCATILATVTGATGDLEEICHDVYDDDIWYTFVLPENATGVIVRTYSDSIELLGSAVIYGGSCDDLTYIGCAYGESMMNEMTGGETYFMRVQSGQVNVEGTIEICLKGIFTVVPNDSCLSAEPFPVIPADGSWVGIHVNSLGATDSGIPACNGYADDDVWYSFVAPEGATFLTYRFPWDPSIQIELFEGECSALSFLGCYNIGYGGFYNLIPGNTYFVRMYHFDSNNYLDFFFELSVPQTVQNDFCSDAIEFPPIPSDGSCVSISGNTILATGEGISTCYGSSHYDIWYKFTVPQDRTAVIIEVEEVNNSSITVQLIRGACDDFEILECIPGPRIDDFSGLTPGATYFLHVVPLFHPNAQFNLCIRAGSTPPVNDECLQATSITNAPGIFTDPGPQTTRGATDSDYDGCYGDYDNRDYTYDIWYSLTTDQDGGDAFVTLTHRDEYIEYQYFNMIFQGMQGSCDSFQTLGCFEDGDYFNGHSDTTITLSLLGLEPLTTYFFRAYASTFTHNYAPVDFTIFAEGSALNPIVGIENNEPEYSDAGVISKVFPSPAGSFVHVEFESGAQQFLSITLADMMGHRVLQNKILTQGGTNYSTFNIDMLPPGMYIVYLENSGMRSVASRFMKQ